MIPPARIVVVVRGRGEELWMRVITLAPLGLGGRT